MNQPRPASQTTKKLTVPDFNRLKEEGKKLVMMTCYDSSFAKVINGTDIDLLLVGDSGAMTMHGFDSTIHADVNMIEFHTAAVARGAPNKFLIADVPFLAVRKGTGEGMRAIERLVKAGAHAVKIEGLRGNEKIIAHIVESGIPVVGHLGLTPQFVNAFGGMRVQAKTEEEQEAMLADAIEYERLGACLLVLECVPSSIAARIARALRIPVVGIGAGAEVDGQVLVLQDLLGFDPGFKPKFLRRYMDGHSLFKEAFSRFSTDVREGTFPNEEEQYR
jgi:3-methyl-2-oxobutanoate hydroxymethyltransferase